MKYTTIIILNSSTPISSCQYNHTISILLATRSSKFFFESAQSSSIAPHIQASLVLTSSIEFIHSQSEINRLKIRFFFCLLGPMTGSLTTRLINIFQTNVILFNLPLYYLHTLACYHRYIQKSYN